MKLASTEGRRTRRHAGRGQPRPHHRRARHRDRADAASRAGAVGHRRAAPQRAFGARSTRSRRDRLHEDPRSRFPLDLHALAAPLAARLRVRRRQRLPAARRARAPRARRRGAAELLHRSADVPGHQRRLPRPARSGARWSSEDYGIDLEAEVVVVTDDVPMAVTPRRPRSHIQLIGLINDVSLRNLIPDELAKGFGFLQSKPRSALVAGAGDPGRTRRCLARTASCTCRCSRTSTASWFGAPEAGVDMQFNFAQLVAHAAKTRPLSAGTIVGSGTIANQDDAQGRLLLRRAAHAGDSCATASRSTPFMTLRRHGADRDVRRGRHLDLRRDRAADGALPLGFAAAGPSPCRSGFSCEQAYRAQSALLQSRPCRSALCAR